MESQTINVDTSSLDFFGYKIRAILLVESSFKRIPSVSNEAQQGEVELKLGHGTSGTNRTVEVGIHLWAPNKERAEVEVFVKMAGVFEASDRIDPDEAVFKSVHAPNLIYPYVREHINILFLKASVPPIMLPFINFTSLHEQDKYSN